MTQELLLGTVSFLVSIGAWLLVRLRRPACAMVRSASRRQSPVR